MASLGGWAPKVRSCWIQATVVVQEFQVRAVLSLAIHCQAGIPRSSQNVRGSEALEAALPLLVLTGDIPGSVHMYC